MLDSSDEEITATGEPCNVNDNVAPGNESGKKKDESEPESSTCTLGQSMTKADFHKLMLDNKDVLDSLLNQREAERGRSSNVTQESAKWQNNNFSQPDGKRFRNERNEPVAGSSGLSAITAAVKVTIRSNNLYQGSTKICQIYQLVMKILQI